MLQIHWNDGIFAQHFLLGDALLPVCATGYVRVRLTFESYVLGV